jgi:xylulokinase
MTAGPVTLGIDIGTSGLKAVLLDAMGGFVDDAPVSYPLHTPRPGWTQQEPGDWWDATQRALRELWARGHDPARVVAVGLTGQMHGLVLLDDTGEILCPALLWNDQRTGAECSEIVRTIGAADLLATTGNPALTGFTLPKILWVRRNWPEAFGRARAVLLPKDFVRFRLTGTLASEMSDASGTLMFDTRRRAWATDLVRAFAIDPGWLPPVVEGNARAGSVTEIAARLTGLVAGTPVIAGGSDNAAAAVGLGAVEPGHLTASIGTSGVVFAPLTAYPAQPPDGRLGVYCHAVPDRWHLMSVAQASGGSMRWLRDLIRPAILAGRNGADTSLDGDALYAWLDDQAASAPAGSDGLVFLPYLAGERTPHADPHARGVFSGLHLGHGLPHLVRAVLEGVAFSLRQGVDLMVEYGADAAELRGTGGGMGSALWRQIVADATGLPIVTPSINPGAARGAAVLAGLGVGLYRDAQVGLVWPEDRRVDPSADAHAALARVYARYVDLYPRLAPAFALAAVEHP